MPVALNVTFNRLLGTGFETAIQPADLELQYGSGEGEGVAQPIGLAPRLSFRKDKRSIWKYKGEFGI
jgi:hypothetical protein